MFSDTFEIRTKIMQCDNIVISGHLKPDGDSVGASLALAMSLSKAGKNVTVLLQQYQENLNIVKGTEFINNSYDGDCDLFIAVDAADISRFSPQAAEFFKKAKSTINIDHHKSNTHYCDLNMVEPQASSCCELIFDIISSDFYMDADIAAALYVGLIFDTASFRHNSTTANTLMVASKLYSFGIPVAELSRKVLYSHTYTQAKLFSKAISKFEIKGRVGFTALSTDEMSAVGSSLLETEGIVDYIIDTDGVEVAAFVYESDGIYKASLRSVADIDVCEIAKVFGGGGHKNAAGCNLNGATADEALNTLLNELKTWME